MVKLVTLVEEMIVAVPLGSVLRSAVVVTAGVGVHSIAGATELAASTPSPLQATVGTPISVAFSITGTLSEPERWFISGSFPPGVSFGGQTSGTVNGGTILLGGTPTTAGNFTINLQANDDIGGNSLVYNYTINVTDPTPTLPAFTTNPQSQTVTAGANVTFTSAATGNPAPTFQWKKNDADIPGATSASLMLANAQPADAATYTVVATNSAGSATSNAATLTVQVPPVFTLHPAAQAKFTGEPVTFTAAATGTPAPTFQWLKNGLEIAGATSTSYTINSLALADAGSFSARATNAAGSVTSTGAVLTVSTALTPPMVTAQPPTHSIAVDGSVEFTVAVSGNPAPTFRWQRTTDGGANWSDVVDGGVFSGAATATLRVTKATVAMNGHHFRAVVTNSEGSSTSDAGVLNVAATAGPRLINLSTRAFAGSGDSTLIMGFFIAGTGSKTLLIRGVGPELAFPPFNVSSVVQNPSLTVYLGGSPIASNDDWLSGDASAFAAVGASALTPGSRDAALVVTLDAGHSYTVHLVNPGVVAEALIEVYDLSRDLGTRLVNLSCRLNIGPGQTVIVGTYLLGGSQSLLVRNIGPALALTFPELFTPGSVLPDPRLTAYAGQTPIDTNDDWDPALAPHFNAVGAFGFANGSKDAALRSVFTQGGYTVHATGTGAGGVALIELYESP